MSKISSPYLLLVNANDLPGAVSSFHYLQRIQEADRDLLVRLEDAQVTYKTEKVDQEELQVTLEEQKSVLGAQKGAKAILLEETRNDEKKYQQLLAAAKSEFFTRSNCWKETNRGWPACSTKKPGDSM